MTSLWEAYKTFVRQNHQWLTSVESAAQGLTWVLPERFASSELAVEGVSSLLGIFQLLNEHIVQAYPASHIPNAPRVPLPPPPSHGAFPDRGPIGGFHGHPQPWRGGRGPPPPGLHGPPPVTDAIPRHVAAHKSLPWPVLLAIVGQLEVLAETAAQEYRGPEKKWGIVALVEGLKVILRLLLLRQSGGRMLIDGGEEPNESAEAVANTAVAAAEATENDRPVLDASDAIVQAGPMGPSPYADEFAAPSKPRDKGGMALHAFAKFRERNLVARAPQLDSAAAAHGKHREPDLEMGHRQPPWWAEDGASSSPEALSTLSVHSRDDPSVGPSSQPSSKQGLSGKVPFQTDGASTSERENSSGGAFLNRYVINTDVRGRGKLQRYDTPRPEDLELPPPSRLLATVMSESIDVESIDPRTLAAQNNETLLSAGSLKPEMSAAERAARTCLTAGEVLYAMRPLVYVLAMRKWGARKWKPWLLSLGVDAASMALIAAGDEVLKRDARGKGKEGEGGLTEQERSEMARRRVLLLLYLMRSPVFEMVTKPPAEAVGRVLWPVPLLGALTSKALEIFEGVQGYYFYTAAS